MGAMKEPVVVSYEADFHAWAFDQADKLRRGDLQHIDIPNLIEEIESLGISQQRELMRRLAQLRRIDDSPQECPCAVQDVMQADWLPPDETATS